MKIEKILWLVIGVEGYGVRRSTLSLAKELNKLGVQTFFVAIREGEFTKALRSQGHEVRVLGDRQIPSFEGGVLGKVLKYIKLRWFNSYAKNALVPLINKIDPDILHVRFNNLVELAGICGKETNTQAVWHLPGVMKNKKLNINRWYLRFICEKYGIHILGNSRYTAKTILEDNIEGHFVHLGISKEQFHPDLVPKKTRQEFGIGEKDIVIGIFARLIHTKGQDIFVKALRDVIIKMKYQTTIHLLLFGDLSNTSYVNSIRSISIPDNLEIHFMNKVDQPESYYGLCDFTVNSRVGPEPFGLSVIESMLMSVPVFANKKGGPGETIIDGETGWLVRKATVEAYSDGLNRVFEDREKWSNMGNKARKHVLENFTSEVMAKNYLTTVGSIN